MIRSPFGGYRSYLVLALIVVAVLATAACTATVNTNTPVPVPTISISISPVSTTTPTSPVPPAGAPAAQTGVRVSLVEWRMDLDKTDVPAGPVRFLVKNDGTTTHAMGIVGNGIDQKTGNLNPGESATLDVQLTPGDYEVYCPVDAHRDEGMTTTLTVE